MLKRLFIVIICISVSTLFGQSEKQTDRVELPLKSAEKLTLINLKAESVEHEGKQGILLSKKEKNTKGETVAIINDVEFTNGTIEVELSGDIAADANPQMRGFVGIAFRLQESEPFNYDCFYLRPKNGRADNQLQRNHSCQYIAHPEYPWYRLRKESAGVYETYVDLQPGEWTKIKIEVSGKKAKFYVHGTEQPTLIVNDLKHETKSGKIALWLHFTTVARFRNLIVTPSDHQ